MHAKLWEFFRISAKGLTVDQMRSPVTASLIAYKRKQAILRGVSPVYDRGRWLSVKWRF